MELLRGRLQGQRRGRGSRSSRPFRRLMDRPHSSNMRPSRTGSVRRSRGSEPPRGTTSVSLGKTRLRERLPFGKVMTVASPSAHTRQPCGKRAASTGIQPADQALGQRERVRGGHDGEEGRLRTAVAKKTSWLSGSMRSTALWDEKNRCMALKQLHQCMPTQARQPASERVWSERVDRGLIAHPDRSRSAARKAASNGAAGHLTDPAKEHRGSLQVLQLGVKVFGTLDVELARHTPVQGLETGTRPGFTAAPKAMTRAS